MLLTLIFCSSLCYGLLKSYKLRKALHVSVHIYRLSSTDVARAQSARSTAPAACQEWPSLLPVLCLRRLAVLCAAMTKVPLNDS